MLATPRAGLWTPRGRQAPSLMLPYGVAGTSPIGVHSRSGSSPTITRAGTRWFQAGSSFVSLAANTHCLESDGTDSFISVFGERTNSLIHSSNAGGWTALGTTLSDSGVASPITGINWQRTVETNGGTYHLTHRNVFASPAQNQRVLAQVLLAAGDRYATLRAWQATGEGAAINVNPTTGSIVLEVDVAPFTVHDSGIRAVDDGWLAWFVYSCSDAVPAAQGVQIALANSESLSATTYDEYSGDATAYPLGVLWCGAQLVVGATGPGPLTETTTAAVTKSAEVISYPVADLGIPGSVELHARTWDTVPTDKRLWAWYDASADAAIELYLDSAAHVHLRVHDGTSENADIEVATAINTGAWFPIAASWEHNYARLRVGSTDAIDTSCALPALADLDVCIVGGGEGTGGQCFDGHIREFRAYKYRRI